MVVLLTDDEVVALATRKESVWPSPLPTVDTESVEAILAAGFRGLRSLEVRELVSGAGELDDRLEDAATIAGRTSMTCVFLASRTLERASWRFASTHYLDDRGWLVEGVDAMGIHHVDRVSGAERREAMHALLQAATSGPVVSPAEHEQVPQLVVLDITDGRPTAAVLASGDGLFASAVGLVGDRLVLSGASEPVSIDDALSRLEKVAR